MQALLERSVPNKILLFPVLAFLVVTALYILSATEVRADHCGGTALGHPGGTSFPCPAPSPSPVPPVQGPNPSPVTCPTGQIWNGTGCIPTTGPTVANPANSPSNSVSNPGLVGDPGGLVSCSGRDCGTCQLIVTGNRVVRFIVLIMIALVVLIAAIGGFRLLTSAGNQAEYQRAKSLLQNVLIGIIIILVAWLIVDTVLKALLHNSGEVNINGQWMPWNQVTCTNQYQLSDGPVIFPGSSYWVNVPTQTAQQIKALYGSVSSSSLSAASQYTAGNCSPSNLQSLGMSASQAQVFSCLAGPESGCNLTAQNSWTSARGVFQVVRGLNDTCHNLNLPSCTKAAQAAGWTGSGNLNCSQAFTGGTSKSNPSRPRQGQQALWQACNDAIDNMQCSVDAAICLYNDAGGYQPWLGKSGVNHHQAQRACAQKYAP